MIYLKTSAKGTAADASALDACIACSANSWPQADCSATLFIFCTCTRACMSPLQQQDSLCLTQWPTQAKVCTLNNIALHSQEGRTNALLSSTPLKTSQKGFSAASDISSPAIK